MLQTFLDIWQIGAERLQALTTLAQLRKVSLTDLIQPLGIQPVTDI
jgi:hypothetical protein